MTTNTIKTPHRGAQTAIPTSYIRSLIIQPENAGDKSMVLSWLLRKLLEKHSRKGPHRKMNDKEYHEYKREELEVGMTVAEPIQIVYGWRRIFRYPIWKKTKIKAMTPKKMKITLENGHVIEVKKDLYREKTGLFEFDYSMEKETAVARAIQNAWKYQNEIAAIHFENLGDDNLCAVTEKLKEAVELTKNH